MSKQTENYVTWIIRGHTRTVYFESAESAYQFWIALPAGTIAKLYQHGKLVAEGDK